MIIKELSLQESYHKGFHVRRDTYPKNENIWHYHQEIEFIYISKGTGTLFVGDCIQPINENSCVLIGSNLPHYWLFFDENNIKQDSIDCVVIHFKYDFLGELFFQLDETKSLKNLLTSSSKAMLLENCTKDFSELFNRILQEQGVLKISKLLEALYFFERYQTIRLVGEEYSILNHSLDQKRMNDVIHYMNKNYRNKVYLEELAELAQMTKNSFCRYFKQKTGKRPMEFVSELRVSHACRLLKSSDMNLKEISFDSGFQSFVNFHKIFKSITKMSPIQYKKSNQHLIKKVVD